MFAHSHMPGIDCLMNQWQTGPHDQFGNARPPKEIRSVANQLGRARTMSETYGAGGWDLSCINQKRIADWEFALGVNFINQHLSYVTIMGARKRDHPQSFSYHEPWWNDYHASASYFSRLSLTMSSGQQVNDVLVRARPARRAAADDRESEQRDGGPAGAIREGRRDHPGLRGAPRSDRRRGVG